MMSPEERAAAVVKEMGEAGADFLSEIGAEDYIASAIKAAETEARNKALEEAAALIAPKAPVDVQQLLAECRDAEASRYSADLSAAKAIRSLKST